MAQVEAQEQMERMAPLAVLVVPVVQGLRVSPVRQAARGQMDLMERPGRAGLQAVQVPAGHPVPAALQVHQVRQEAREVQGPAVPPALQERTARQGHQE